MFEPGCISPGPVGVAVVAIGAYQRRRTAVWGAAVASAVEGWSSATLSTIPPPFL